MGLLDVLQSASNAVAGNVAGPVDLLSFALRKAGIPVPEDALGGSEWMKRKGLMRDVPKGAEQVVGETLGLLAPTAIAANAPKIARGLLQMGENAAAPKTLHPEAGAIVWHGSPHKFDKFDSSKIGTGEGAQAYGHGIYVAQRPEVAQGYADALKPLTSVENLTVGNLPVYTRGKPVDYSPYQFTNSPKTADHVRAKLQEDLLINEWQLKEAFDKSGVQGVQNVLRSNLDESLKWAQDEWKDAVPFIQKYIKNLEGGVGTKVDFKPGTSYMYKADVPDEMIPQMLRWDKTFAQQPGPVKEALRSTGLLKEYNANLSNFASPMTTRNRNKRGENLLSFVEYKFGNDPAKASEYLRDAGIQGVRYLDAQSRAAGRGTSNFVIFPGLEDQLKILERNGVPLGLLTP